MWVDITPHMSDGSKFCPECGKRHNQIQKQCFNCYTNMPDSDLSDVDLSGSETKQCPECNTELPQSYVYCTNCQRRDPSLTEKPDDTTEKKSEQEFEFGESKEYHREQIDELKREYPYLNTLFGTFFHPFSVKPDLKLAYHQIGLIIAETSE